MTPQEAKELLPIIEAYANGETIQCEHKGEGDWTDEPTPDFNFSHRFNFRIKPKPRLVEMAHEDLPAVFWVQKKKGNGIAALVTVICPDGDLETEREYISYDDLCNWRWSPDRKTWQDFTKEVTE